MSVPKIGYAYGKCPVCGREFRVKRPAPDWVVCPCFEYCPLENFTKKMQPYTPDLTPSTYKAEESHAVKGQAVEAHEGGLDVLYVHISEEDHNQPYYSKQKPVEVRLK
ncbi:MAG: hypothetical protein ACE5I5_19930 [Candidatus Heimdallarchaeota archaeon]